MLGTAPVAYEEFKTTLVEVEGIIILNSQPLTYVNEDIKEPFTPSSLRNGQRLLSPTQNT